MWLSSGAAILLPWAIGGFGRTLGFATVKRFESIPVCGWLLPHLFNWQQPQIQQRVRTAKTWRTRGCYSILENIRGGSAEITSPFAQTQTQTQKEGGTRMKQQQCFRTEEEEEEEEEEWEDMLDDESWMLDLEDLDVVDVEALLSELDLNSTANELLLSSKSLRSDNTLPAVDMEEWLQEEASTRVPLEPKRKKLHELLNEDSSWGQEEEEEENDASLSDDEGGILKPTKSLVEDCQRVAASRTTRNQLIKLCILYFGCSILPLRMLTPKADYHFHAKCASGFQCLGCALCDLIISRRINNAATGAITTRFHYLNEKGGDGDRGSLSKSVIQVPEVSFLGALKRKAPRNQVKMVEEHDLACLARIRIWSLLYFMIGFCSLLLFGVVEPLFIGAAMAVNHYTSDPLFCNLVLGQIKFERPFTPPSMLNALLGACHVPQHVPPPNSGGLHTNKRIAAQPMAIKKKEY